MQIALYRKYRSKSLNEVVGQKHITDTLSAAVESDRIRHAYLFTGPHGVGKTSVARIFAHLINELPYDESTHLDIIEIDAASNRRIDEVRDLREKARIAPTSAKYKVYIIDEVHMLTNEAFNALLKTLEEPPEHVIFILATTEAHKLPDTIISRTQRFHFSSISPESVESHLKSIAKKESVKIDQAAISLIAEQSNGSLRDAISMLDQVATSKDDVVSEKTVEDLLGIASSASIKAIVEAIFSHKPAEVHNLLKELAQAGHSAATIARQLISDLVGSDKIADKNALELVDELLTVSASSDPSKKLLVTSMQASLPQTEQPTKPRTEVPAEPKQPAIQPAKERPTKPPVISEQPTSQPEPKKPTQTKGKAIEKNDDWTAVLNEVKSKNNSLYAILRMAEPRINDQTLTLAFRFPFHQKRVEQSKNRQLLHETINTTYGQDFQLELTHDSNIAITPPSDDFEATPVVPANNQSNTVVDIMGGGEVVAYEEA